MHYTGFPSILVGHSYELKYNKSNLIAHCKSSNQFVIKQGSVIDLSNWPNCLESNFKDPNWNLADVNLALSNCAVNNDNGLLTFVKDYDGATPIEMAWMATGKDEPGLDALWSEAQP